MRDKETSKRWQEIKKAKKLEWDKLSKEKKEKFKKTLQKEADIEKEEEK